MSSLLWPGDHRAGTILSDASLVQAMVRVEAAWLEALVETGIADAAAADPLDGLVRDGDLTALAVDAERGGNPVIPLVALLRQRVRERTPAAATWLHRGLTSQDVLDTALMLGARVAVARVDTEIRAQVGALSRLADRHRDTRMVGRTLTQHAVPITFGLKVSTWLDGVLDAADALVLDWPAQLGGAAGNLSAATELARRAGLDDPPKRAFELVARTAATLGLVARTPWHTARAPVTRIGDAMVGCTAAWGRIANDVLTLSRPEIAELAEPAADGRGGSSAMPQKVNPVLSVLVRRAALAAPALAGQLHLAAAGALDERPDGAWHLEWPALQQLARHTVTAAAQTTELVSGLHVDTERMSVTLQAARPGVDAEQRSVAALFDTARPIGDHLRGADDPYLGAHDLIIDATLDRARARLASAG